MTAHKHVCRCGAFYVCTLPYDQCPMKIWDCPVCVDRELDRYMTRLETQRTAQEMTRHEG